MKTRNLCFGLVLAVLSIHAVVADTLALRPDAPERYVVVKGDTLWDISARFLRDPWLWPEIWQANPGIANPHLIYPGDLILLSYDSDGRPILKIQRGGDSLSASGLQNNKLSPTVRSSPLDSAIPAIPLDAIQQFLTKARIVTQEEYDRAPYIVAFSDDRLIAATTDQAYVRGIKSEDKFKRYSIIRLGKPYRNPGAKPDEILGYETIEVAGADLEQPGDPASLVIIRAEREVLAGDRLFPIIDSELQQNYTPHAPDKPIEGTIIAVLDGVSRIGQFHVVVLNQGKKAGVEPGHVLAVYQSGRKVRDNFAAKPGELVTLPDEEAGIVLVFRTFDDVSYALVMRALRDMRLHDKVQNP